MVPGEVMPLPQSIVAVNWLGRALLLATEKIATGPVKETPELAVKFRAVPVKKVPKMVKGSARELPTLGVKTVTAAVPPWASRLAGMRAVIWLLVR